MLIKHNIKNDLKHFFKDKNLINYLNKSPTIEKIELKNYGFNLTIDISRICSFKEIENNTDYLKQLFKAEEVELENKEGKVNIDVINESPGELDYRYLKLPSTSLLVGYDNKGNNIISDMLKTPHVGVQGLSNTGKSKCVELMLKNIKGADIILLNCFKNDFKSINSRRINNPNEILEYLKNCLYVHIMPCYIVIDEILVLSNDKKISKAISDLLAQARHYNIYIIAISQSMLKESCSYKHLFNTRISFKMIDKSSIRAFIGFDIDAELSQREFIMYSDRIIKGKSYLLR